MLTLRVDEQTKEQLQAAAAARGTTLTAFVLAAAKNAAVRAPARAVRDGVPSWILAACDQAARGGHGGYETVGFMVARAAAGEPPDGLDPQEWTDQVAHLVDAGDEDAVWGWFARFYPSMTDLIPARRRGQFVAGVSRARRVDDEIGDSSIPSSHDGWAWYAWEQLGMVYSNLIGEGSLEDRLVRAAENRVSVISAHMVPPQQRELLNKVHDRLLHEGSYASSVAAMSDEEREEAARDLMTLWFECERAFAEGWRSRQEP